MADLFTPDNLFTLVMLVFLQAVLGFDNLLYISIESKRVPKESAQFVRRMGIGLAIGLRIVLLFVVTAAIEMFQAPFAAFHSSWLSFDMNVHAVIVLAGGAFIMYTAFKEITHMLSVSHLGDEGKKEEKSTVARTVAMIVLMNLVFSFDSILSALALTDVFLVMAAAIVISGVMMMLLADKVADFLEKNRMYEVLGLFVLLIVGVMLVGEGGHIGHIHFGGYAVEPMAKTTFYFSICILVLVDIAQGRYQKKLDLERAGEQAHGAEA